MLLRKNYKKIVKKKEQIKKNVFSFYLTVFSPAFPKKKKRGRPKLSPFVKIFRFYQNKINKTVKEIQVSRNKLSYQFRQFLLRTGLKKGRGRKKLAFSIRLRRYLLNQKKIISKKTKKIIQKVNYFWIKVLRFLHLKKRVGRPKKKKPSLTARPRFSFPFRFSYFISFIFSILFLFIAYQTYTQIIRDLPAPTDLSNKSQILSSRILDRNGKLLYQVYQDEDRILVPLNEVSPYLINASIAIEDKDFYQHMGFSLKGISRALLQNIAENSTQGGSTITQQLVKNRLLSNEKTLARKIKELLLSVLVERLYSKEQILEMYLNTVAYGGSSYGIESAAQRYFAKSSRDLDLAESALLAGLPQSPSVYSPFGNNPERSYERQTEVLRRMLEDGYISQLQAEDARNEKLSFNQDRTEIEAPHFVMYVRKLLAERYGERILSQGGLEIRTTLDLDLQNLSQNVVSSEIAKLKNLRINNGAALLSNPKTGEILAMVGSVNYFDFESDGQVNVTLRPRQPGSSIKPLTYALAFENGKKPSNFIEDAPVIYQIPGSQAYAPRNYDGKFHGKVTLREALASSYNIPAVKLTNELGVTALINMGESLGISTWKERNRFGLSLTLGAGEVRMIDMAELYSSFANYGYPVPLNPLLEVRDSHGNLLYRNDCALDEGNCYGERELSTMTAYFITDILSDNQARSPAFGSHSVLRIPNQQVAVKTGTTNNLKDNWTIGYTTDRLLATWVGNNDSSSMSYVVSGITGASPIWNKIILQILDEKKPHLFTTPDNLEKVMICANTMTLPCAACPKIREELFEEGQAPTKACRAEDFIPKETEKKENI